jgi:hypothetical protein
MNCVRGAVGINLTVGGTGMEIPDGHFNNNASTGCVFAGIGGGGVIGTIYCCANTGAGFGDGSLHGPVLTRITKVSSFSNRSAGHTFNSNKGSYFQTVLSHNNATSGVTEGASGTTNYMRIDTLKAYDNGTYGLIFDAAGMSDMDLRVVDLQNNASQGLFLGAMAGKTVIGSLTTAGNGTAGVQINGTTMGGEVVIKKSSISEATKITETSLNGSAGQIGRVLFQNYLGVAGDVLSYIHGGAGKVTTESGANRHTGSGVAWKMEVINAVITADVPLRLVLAKLAVNASAQVTVTAWMRRSNTGLTASLVCRGLQIEGVDADVGSSMTVAADTYEQLTILFTPTVAGVVNIEMVLYGGLYSAIVDDLTFAQA